MLRSSKGPSNPSLVLWLPLPKNKYHFRTVISGRGRILMAELQIRFDAGAAYERMMGTWSRLAGNIFLDWLAPRQGLRWIDIGCGNGAFTELLAERCSPAEIQGVDPSDAQLAFARKRPSARVATF